MNTQEWNVYEKSNNEKLEEIKERLMIAYENKNVSLYKNGLRDMEKAYHLYTNTTSKHFKELILEIMKENPEFELKMKDSGISTVDEKYLFFYKEILFMEFSGALHDDFNKLDIETITKSLERDELKRNLDEKHLEKMKAEKYIRMVSSMLENPKIVFNESFRKENKLNHKETHGLGRMKNLVDNYSSYRTLLKPDVKENMKIALDNQKTKLVYLNEQIQQLNEKMSYSDEKIKTLSELKQLLSGFVEKYNFDAVKSQFL